MATEVQRLLAPVMGERERDAAVIALRALLRRGELVDRDADMVRGAVEAMQTAPEFRAHIGRPLDAEQRELGAAAQNRLGRFVRGSATSRAAALRNFPRSGSQRLDVLHRVAREGAGGATRDELVLWLGRSPQSVTPRVKELLEAGWLETKLHDDGSAAMRRTRSGADAQVLVLTARARQEMRRRGVRLTAS
jgi:hypothetical protein